MKTKKLISVTCPKLDNEHFYLTSLKTYEVIQDLKTAFEIISDNGSVTYGVLKNDGHIEYKNWILNYEK